MIDEINVFRDMVNIFDIVTFDLNRPTLCFSLFDTSSLILFSVGLNTDSTKFLNV